MVSEKTYKVMVLGLPKTGTSTLALMLRMLGYQVTGPEINFKKGDLTYLNRSFERANAFQDFPWCFEWQRYFEDPSVKFIVLKRDPSAWCRSFLESYGGRGTQYLSYSYMRLEKHLSNEKAFIEFYYNYYRDLQSKQTNFPERFLELDIQTFQWNDLCSFLKEPLPRNFFGKPVKKPHVKIQHAKQRKTKKYLLFTSIRKKALPILGLKTWNALIVFLRKNGIYQ